MFFANDTTLISDTMVPLLKDTLDNGHLVRTELFDSKYYECL